MTVSKDRPIRPDKVAIYIRWSTEEQTDGTTLAEQREGCEFYVRSQGWFVNPGLIFIDDGFSGATLDRPGIRQIRDMVKKSEIDCVVVLKIDRLSRNIVDATQLVLDEWSGQCHLRCVRQPIDTTSETGRMFFSILATFADFERAQITERTYHGRIRRVQEGKHAALVPFGLMATGERGVRAVHPEQAPIVVEMFRLVKEEGLGTTAVLHWLNSQGIAPPSSKQWSLNTVRRILRNPIYAGRIVYGEHESIKKAGRKTAYRQKREEPTVVTDATTVPALVSSEVFDAVQVILGERAGFHAKHRRGSDGAHLLSSIARCRCGSNMNAHWSNGTRYYMCSKYMMGGKDACTAVNGTLKADHVDEAVVNDLLSTFGDPALRFEALNRAQASAGNTTGTLEQEKATLGAEIAKVDKRLGELRLAAGVGDISLEEWRNLREVLEEKRRGLAGRLSAVEKSLNQAATGINEERLLLDRLGDLDRWHDLDPVQQKDLLRRLAHEIELYKPRGKNQTYQVKVTWRFAPAT